MNKALTKLDEHIDQVTKKLDTTVERTLDQVFAKFSEHVNEIQESTRKAEQVVQKALDETLIRFSDRLMELQSPGRMEQGRQDRVEVEEAGISTHTVIDGPEEPETEPMELEESESTSRADIEDDDSDEGSVDGDSSDDKGLSENLPQVIWEYPRPGRTYAIHLDDELKAMLAIDDIDPPPILIAHAYVTAKVNKNETRYCHWECITRGKKEGFYFRNVATQKYLGVTFRGYWPELNARNDRGNTRFCPESMGGNSYLLQARKDRFSAYVTAGYEAFGKCTWFDEDDIEFSCDREKNSCLKKWKFRRIFDQ